MRPATLQRASSEAGRSKAGGRSDQGCGEDRDAAAAAHSRAAPTSARAPDAVDPNYLNHVIERAASAAMASRPQSSLLRVSRGAAEMQRHETGLGRIGASGAAAAAPLVHASNPPQAGLAAAISHASPSARPSPSTPAPASVPLVPTPPGVPPPDFTARKKRISP
jgi:hypothetical protein